jgi:hypothetical protein
MVGEKANRDAGEEEIQGGTGKNPLANATLTLEFENECCRRGNREASDDADPICYLRDKGESDQILG